MNSASDDNIKNGFASLIHQLEYYLILSVMLIFLKKVLLP